MQRLCLATDSLDPSGVGEHMLVLASELRNTFDIVVACPPSAGGEHLLDRAARLGVAVNKLEDHEPVEDWLSRTGFAILHVHAGIGWEGHALAAAGRAAAVPRIVRTEHLPDVITDPSQRAGHAGGIALVDRVICVSAASARSYAASGVDETKIAVIRNGIPSRAATLTREVVRRQMDLGVDQPVAFTAARFTAQKDHAALIDAAPSVLERVPDLRFVFAGDGPLIEDCRSRAHHLGVADAVMFLGSRPDVRELLEAADLFVLPSRFEGLPLAVIEAMAAGVPVVSTRVGGTDEVVLDGVTGILVPPGDAMALADAIVAMLADRPRATAMGAAGRTRFDGDFTAGRMASETARLYRTLDD